MPRGRSALRLATTLAAFVWLAPEAPADSPQRVVAIGDIHGAYDQLVSILETAGLIDAGGDWAGGSTRFVQTGDFTDRGAGVREAMELLMKLQRQARDGEGAVHVLLGNHEAMNLIGNDRDARFNPEIFTRFVDSESGERRQKAAKAWLKWRRGRLLVQNRIDADATAELSPDLRAFLERDDEEWLETHPPGLIEYHSAFAPDSVLGFWLRRLPVAVKVGETLFLHGGISPTLAAHSLEEINTLHRERIAEWDDQRRRLEKRRLIPSHFSWSETRLALEHHLYFPASASDRQLAADAWELMNRVRGDLFAEQSALWYRGYAPAPLGLTDERLGLLLDTTDAAYDVRRTVAGHTPLADHSVLERLGGRLFLIDTGMLASFYGGRPSALEITAAGATPIYVGTEPALTATNGDHQEEEAAPIEDAAEAEKGRLFYDPDGNPLPFQERSEIERFLREAAPVSSKPVGQGKTGAIKVLLERAGVRTHAIFHSIDEKDGSPTRPVILDDRTKLLYFRDSYRGQVAAYELSKLLGMDNVPPAVVRRFGGHQGSMALWIENGINLFGWREREGGDPGDPRLHRQMHDMRVFDNLIDNTDRNSQNIFWKGDNELWLIDHTRTMTQSRQLHKPDKLTRCSRRMLEHLQQLDPEEMGRRLEPYLSKFEVKSLLKRRDLVLEKIEESIRKQGENKVIFEHDAVPGFTISVQDQDEPNAA